MTPHYEEVPSPHFTVEHVGGVERFTVRPPRNYLAAGGLAVLGVALTGVEAYLTYLMHLALSLQALPPVWVLRPSSATLYACFIVAILALAVGLSTLLLGLSWMLAGAEILDVSDGGLAVTHRVLGFARTKRYRGEDISDVSADVAHPLQGKQGGIPLLWPATTGSVRFSYGVRTVYLAQDLEVGEGRMLAAALRESLHTAATHRKSRNEP